MTLPFQDARPLADGARARALELGKALSIAVADYGGFVVLIERMDGARPMTPDIALSKAYSVAVMQRPTEMLEAGATRSRLFHPGRPDGPASHRRHQGRNTLNVTARSGRHRDLRGGGRGPADLRGQETPVSSCPARSCGPGAPGLRFYTRLKTAAVRFAW